ncbi:MAG: hypothetical protein ACYS8Z_07730 [Planctomycetota bacterium]|jgi:hypothetical protein
MGKYHGPKEYLEAAKSPDATLEELRELAKSPYDFVRVAVVRHPKCDMDLLRELAKSSYGSVRVAIARHPKCDMDLLLSLIPENLDKSWDQELAIIVIENPNTPSEVLSSLAELFMGFVYSHAEDHGRFQGALSLCCDRRIPIDDIARLLQGERTSKHFRRIVARETRRRDVLDILLSDRSEIVRRRATKTLDILSQSGLEETAD